MFLHKVKLRPQQIIWNVYLTSVPIAGPSHRWLPLLSPPGLLPPPCPPLSSSLTRLLLLWRVATIRYRLKRAFFILVFILRWEHRTAGESVAVHRGEAGMAAEGAPSLVAWVAVAWRAITGSAVAGSAVARSVAKLTLIFTCGSVGAPANPSS